MKKQLIGKGAFTKAYLGTDGNVYLNSSCPIKECMAQGWFPSSRVFPKIEKLDYQKYKMRYYPRVSRLKSELDPKEWEKYKNLRQIFNGSFMRKPLNSACLIEFWYKEFDKVQNKTLRQHLKDAIEACSNVSRAPDFEISPRNVTVSNGKLILLDVFFCRDELEKTRKPRRWA